MPRLPGSALYAAQTGRWTQVWDPSMRYAMGIGQAAAADRENIAAGTRVLAVIFSSVSTTYGFELFDDGVPTRSVVYADGEAVVESGEPLPVESTLALPSWGPDEDFVWSLGVEDVRCHPEALGRLCDLYGISIESVLSA